MQKSLSAVISLPREFPKEVLEEAEKVAVINEEDYKGRKDFRDWMDRHN